MLVITAIEMHTAEAKQGDVGSNRAVKAKNNHLQPMRYVNLVISPANSSYHGKVHILHLPGW